MRIGFMGDTHANTRRAVNLINLFADDGIKVIVQTGDFGFWPRMPKGVEFLRSVSNACKYRQVTLHWVDGNHEDHEFLRHTQTRAVSVEPRVVWHPRGTVTTIYGKKFLWMGGAVSVDKYVRTPGRDWFHTETPNMEQWDRALSAGKVDVMVSHDAPSGTTMRGMPDEWIPNELLHASESLRHGLFRVCEETQPSLVVHGHWHERKTTVLPEYTVVALGHDYGTPEDQIVVIESKEIGPDMKLSAIESPRAPDYY